MLITMLISNLFIRIMILDIIKLFIYNDIIIIKNTIKIYELDYN